MARPMILPAAALAAFALTALPLMAQEAPPPAPAPEAGFRLDFGGGRELKVDCGATAIDACLGAAMPVIDKLAATPAVEGPGMMGPHGKFDRGGKHWFHGKDGGRGKGAGKGAGKGPDMDAGKGPEMDPGPGPGEGPGPEGVPIPPAPQP